MPLPSKKPNSPAHKKQSKIVAACLMLAAKTYNIPPAILVGMYKMEVGLVGKKYGPLEDGTYNIGPMKINSSYIQTIAQHWGETEDVVDDLLTNDICANISVSAWLFQKHLSKTSSLADAIFEYGNRESSYKEKFIQILRENGLLRNTSK